MDIWKVRWEGEGMMYAPEHGYWKREVRIVKALRPLVVEELERQLQHAGRKLSETPPFPYSCLTLPARKPVFNLVPCGNEFEKALAKFLEDASDIGAFAKLLE